MRMNDGFVPAAITTIDQSIRIAKYATWSGQSI